jgi:hypothetical protein
MRKVIATVGLVLALACASGPSAQRTIDVAQDAFTTTCESAMSPATKAKVDAETFVEIKAACAVGGRASLDAQSAFAMYEAVPEDQKAEWFQKMQFSLDILRGVTAQVIAITGAK